jgi:hypothetical protein
VPVEVVTREQLATAARMVLGREAERGLAGDVPLPELRRAFRRRALEAHPDRARVLGRPEWQLAAEFRALAAAYAILEGVAACKVRVETVRPAARVRTTPAPPASPRPTRPTPRPRVAAGPLPRRRLRLAEFLYYSGRVSFRVAAEAVVWQRRQRPPLGRLAVQWGHLQPDDVLELLSARRRDQSGELFGEYALRKGVLKPGQLLALLGQQRRLQRPIGDYFVESGIVDQAEMEASVAALLRHNARCF